MFRINLEIIEKLKKLIRHNFLPENRLDTIKEIIAVLIWMVSTLMFYFIMRDIFPDMKFWKGQNLIAIVASFFVVDGLLYSFIYRNLFELTSQIENHKIDHMLLLPTNFQSYTSFRKLQFSSLIQVPTSIILLILFMDVSILEFILWFVSLVIGYWIAYHIWYTLSLLSFWLRIGEKATFVFEELGIVSMFPALPFIRSKLFVVFFPFLTFACYSAVGLLEGNWPRVYLLQISTLVIAVTLAQIIQYFGLQKYRS